MPQALNATTQPSTECPWTPIPEFIGKSWSADAVWNPLHVCLALLLLFDLQQQRSVDVWEDTAECDRGSDQGVQFFVTTDGELKVAGSDTLDLEILGGVACEFQNFSCQVFQDGGDVDGGCL